MRKIKKVVKKETYEETLDIVCNKCGHTCSNLKRFNQANKNQIIGYSGLVETEVHGGYDSKIIGDMTSWKFSLCETCLNELVLKFKIEVEVKGESSSTYLPKKEYDKIAKKQEKDNLKQYYKEIKKLGKALDKDISKKDLERKSTQELNEFYHKLAAQLSGKRKK